MAKKLISIDSVRASREGHEFHETWTARIALQLLLPTNNLAGIAVEGLHPADQSEAASKTVEIADVVLYYGKGSTFEDADNVKIIQCKYSISNKDSYFRASHAKKTIVKFAAAHLDHKKRYSANKVRDKLEFELITNRPIFPAFEQAIIAIAEGKTLSGEIKKQADQFTVSCGLNGKPLVEFAGKFQITGLAGSLSDNKRYLSRTVVDWSAADGAIARARLGEVRQMVRDKAGYAGTNKNVIRTVDVLAALYVADVEELLPCPASLREVGKVVEREQLAEAIALIPDLDKPLLIHSAGGIGKTVFLASLAQSLSDNHEVLLFDCFGGGQYRAPEDSRHLPGRGLVHIVNSLACRGLCDPLLPGNDDVGSLIRTLRRRFSQCVRTLSTASVERQLILLIDAIDNAAVHAKDKNEPSFPTLLLESLHHGGSIPGVKLIVTCRSHHMDISAKDIPCHKFRLEPFNLSETESYLRGRVPNVTQTEIQVAQARSGGNARILEHLVTSDRGLLDQSEIEKLIELDDLLFDRIQKALSFAEERGSKKVDTDAFLAGLSILPPPVPIDEYAGAHGIDDISSIESFAADLAPLLEQTKYGLMFRDEPTETLIRENFGSDEKALQRVAKNLHNRQDSSVYAARALPDLLLRLDSGKQLFELAFDEIFPQSITSTVGKRRIRYARLKASALHSANTQNYNRLVHLLVELSTIAAVDQRGAHYILDNPDLVIAAQDVDATRRLFETRTTWPGTRHARLSIANILSGDLNDAYRHAVRADEWIFHYRQKDRVKSMEHTGPERLDIAAIPFCLIIQNRAKDAIKFMRGCKDWYAYEVGEHLFGLLRQSESAMSQVKSNISEFLDIAADDIGVITSALSFLNLDHTQQNLLIKKLSKACKNEKNLEKNDRFFREANYRLQDGLLKATVIAVSLGLGKDAITICHRTPFERPGIWYYNDRISNSNVFLFLVHLALLSVVKGDEIRERDILPNEIYKISKGISNTASDVEFREKLKNRLENRARAKRDQSDKDNNSISYELKRDADRFIENRLEPLLKLAKAFSGLLGMPVKKGDEAFLELLHTWAETRRRRDQYSRGKYDLFFQMLGSQIAVFALWVRPDMNVSSVQKFLERLHEQEILSATTLIKVVAILANRSHLHVLAGEQAVKVRSLIENEYDVGSRASLYAQLARAILSASRDEVSVYFKTGLEQMDAIGSGDYQFTNELLLFVSSLRGDELADQDFHTLTNLCELNMSDEEEKFPWFEFAKGLSRTSGCKTLAKLARWDDRSKVSLSYTLLPYLTALIDDGKIVPEDALALNRLASPVELYVCSTATFAEAISEKNYPNSEMLVSELIQQYIANNPGVPLSSTLKTLASIAERVMAKASDMTSYLSAAHEHYGKIRDELNEQMNYRGRSDPQFPERVMITDRQNKTKLKSLASRTKPNDEASIRRAIDELNEMQHIYDLKGEFFENLRSKVSFSNRPLYIKTISKLENLDIYTKFDELKKCKSEWGASSTALASTYKALGIPMLKLHAEKFVSYEQLSHYSLKEVSDLSEVPISILALELIKMYASPDSLAPASVWLGLASIICEKAEDGEGQGALIRLLNSNSAKLASAVADGEWKDELYPINDSIEISSGLLRRMLGSPHAPDRWRAAHSMRCFAKFERWKVIDALVDKFKKEDAHPFQAPELTFYYMHARLWLLIALARIALDSPKNIARYRKFLIEIVLDEDIPHVLMRHFASQAILACVDKGSIELSAGMEKQIRAINLSPYLQHRKRQKEGGDDSFYKGRPDDALEPEAKFHLDYDFEKLYVYGLSNVFGVPGWMVSDILSEVVRNFDTDIESMYKTGGRDERRREGFGIMTSKYHSYGQQLGWHALFIVAGKLLSQNPVTDDSYEEEPWLEFLNRWLLTRNDGLWLSDCIDKPPLETKINLLEKGDEGLVLTGDKGKIQGLVEIDGKIIVQANWHTPDDIEVQISSALVASNRAAPVAKQLILEEPFFAWIPVYDEYESEESFLGREKNEFIPYIVRSYIEGRLDKDDPLGSICAVRRPYFTESIINTFSLKASDPFKRNWNNSSGRLIAEAHAWGSDNDQRESSSISGTRLLCTQDFLRDVLGTFDADLLILIKLERYEKGFSHRESRFSHTVAVLQIKKTLEIEFHKGAVNMVHKPQY